MFFDLFSPDVSTLRELQALSCVCMLCCFIIYKLYINRVSVLASSSSGFRSRVLQRSKAEEEYRLDALLLSLLDR